MKSIPGEMFRVMQVYRSYLLKIGFFFLLSIVYLVYSTHFDNSFHFDDSHTIVNNPFIRDLGNMPRFFYDADTFSVNPLNRSYRPLVTATLAVDYWLSNKWFMEGLNPLFYHISSFLCFVVLLSLMQLLYVRVLSQASNNLILVKTTAFFITAWYALHPANADTVNYIIQRAEIQSAIGVVAGLLLFANSAVSRRLGLYLIPVIIGALAKPLAIMFAPIIFVYVLFFEKNIGFDIWRKNYSWRSFFSVFLVAAPSIFTCAMLYILQSKLTSKDFTPGGESLSRYLLTQPWVYLYYVKSLFYPAHLTVDSDWKTFTSIYDLRAVAGILFVLCLAVIALVTSRREDLRPVSFGILWFFFALAPTTFVPLAEVVNNHRMFFPSIGLMLSVCWGAIIIFKYLQLRFDFLSRSFSYRWLFIIPFLLLPPYALATYQRNIVWDSEESLWLDTTQKSPGNGRALMNYGLTLMAKGNYSSALDYFERARLLTPNYSHLEVNLGIVKGALGQTSKAEEHFRRAIALSPKLATPYFFYGRWLSSIGRATEAISNLKQAVSIVPSYMDSRYLLMKLYYENKNWLALQAEVNDSLRYSKNDDLVNQYAELLKAGADNELVEAQYAVNKDRSPENLLNLSFAYFKVGEFQKCIDNAQRALELKADYAEAYNNISSANAELGNWEEAIKAAENALKINPNYVLARNNLNWAIAQLAQSQARNQTIK